MGLLLWVFGLLVSYVLVRDATCEFGVVDVWTLILGVLGLRWLSRGLGEGCLGGWGFLTSCFVVGVI